jgi:hypothetical protein
MSNKDDTFCRGNFSGGAIICFIFCGWLLFWETTVPRKSVGFCLMGQDS